MDHSETKPFSHLPNVNVVTDSMGLDEGGVESSFTFSVSPNKSELSLESRCFVCWGCITKTDTVTNDPELSLFQQLLSTFDLRPCVLNMLKADNSCIPNAEFCNCCSSYLMEVATLMRKVEEIKIRLTNLRKHLKSELVSSFLANPDDKENSVHGKVLLRKAFAQCWSDCVVQLTRIPNNKKRRRRTPKTTIRKVRKPSVDDVVVTEPENILNPSASRNSPNDVEVGQVDEPCESQTYMYIESSPESPIPPSTSLDGVNEGVKAKRAIPKKKQIKRSKTDLTIYNEIEDTVKCNYCDRVFGKAIRIDETGQKEILYTPQSREMKKVKSLRRKHMNECPENPSIKYKTLPPVLGVFKCHYEQCDKEYKIKSALVYHIATIHEKSFRYYCEICGQGFQVFSMLKRHRDHVHTTEKRYKCNLCEQRFKRQHQLLYHHRTHTGEQPYICELCGKGFHVKQKLTIHKESHLEVSTVPCPMCGKLFKSKAYVKNHINTTHLGMRKGKRNRSRVVAFVQPASAGDKPVESKPKLKTEEVDVAADMTLKSQACGKSGKTKRTKTKRQKQSSKNQSISPAFVPPRTSKDIKSDEVPPCPNYVLEYVV